MPPKLRSPAKDYFSEPKRRKKVMTITEKIKLVSGLNKTENIFNFSYSFFCQFSEK